MEIELDPDKDAANIAKHGISLAAAAYIEWDTAHVWIDGRFDYDELRMGGLGYIGLRLYYVAFVDREVESGDAGQVQTIRRIISLRHAEKREYRDYASA